ncbi:sugar ABC transporter substrate-binding protein [Niallia sp. 03190]|uniref:sugar ABC transporter substrate-binding protein n=1 Tax=Niallia sp. 03190 TaxID=3458061 RepID=UPI0040449691
MRKKWFIILVCIVFFGGLLSYIIKEMNQKKPKIVVVLKETKTDYWRMMIAGLENAFTNYEVEGKVLAMDNTNETQLVILKQVLEEKPDALIFSPDHPKAFIPILKEYKRNNIPVLLVDTNLEWLDKTSFIGTNNIALGKKAGELLSSMAQPNDKILLMGWKSNDIVIGDRIEGANETLNNAGIHTIIEDQSEHGEKIEQILTRVLQTNPKLKGIFAGDDITALKVMKILQEKKLEIPVVGADGIIKMVELIEKGTLKSTIAQNPYDMGYISVENALKAIDGKKVNKEIDSNVDIITRDNAKSKMSFIEKITQNE